MTTHDLERLTARLDCAAPDQETPPPGEEEQEEEGEGEESGTETGEPEQPTPDKAMLYAARVASADHAHRLHVARRVQLITAHYWSTGSSTLTN